MSGRDQFGPLFAEPDYDTAAQAALVMAATGIAMKFRHEIVALAERYAVELAAELAAVSSAENNEGG